MTGEPLDDSRRRSAGLLGKKREEARGSKEELVTKEADRTLLGQLTECRVLTVILCQINHLLQFPRTIARLQSLSCRLHPQACLAFPLPGQLLLLSSKVRPVAEVRLSAKVHQQDHSECKPCIVVGPLFEDCPMHLVGYPSQMI